MLYEWNQNQDDQICYNVIRMSIFFEDNVFEIILIYKIFNIKCTNNFASLK